jgi:glycosyltransferase involved in cell wall biosynthesis
MTSTRRPLATVVMPAYNAARFIAQAVASVRRQTVADWELVIVDDGSTDDTGRIVSRIRDARIRCIRTENRGPTAARNRGLTEARGEVVAFLDSDDVWFPQKLAAQMDVFAREPEVGLVHTNVLFITEDGRRIRTGRGTLKRTPDGDCLDRIIVRNAVVTSTAAIRRSLLARTGDFCPELRGPEDWDLWWRFAACSRFRYIPRVLAAYRVRKESVSTNLDVVEESCRRVIERAFSHPEVTRRFAPARLKRLKRKAEAYYLYEAAKRALRAGETSRAAAEAWRSVRCSLYDVRQAGLLLVALGSKMPLAGRAFFQKAGRAES